MLPTKENMAESYLHRFSTPILIFRHHLQFDMEYEVLQLSTSSLAIHGGAIFSAVSGRKSIPISAIEAPEHGACYRVHGFYLTTTCCSTLAQQAVSH